MLEDIEVRSPFDEAIKNLPTVAKIGNGRKALWEDKETGNEEEEEGKLFTYVI